MSVSYRQYYLQGDEFLTEYDDADTVERIFAGNSLAAGGPEHLTMFAGTHTGRIRLTTEQCAAEPPLDGEGAAAVSVGCGRGRGGRELRHRRSRVVPGPGAGAWAGRG